MLRLLEKGLTHKLRRFRTVSNFFLFCLTLPVPEKSTNSIFEIPITMQALNMNNLRNTSAKSISLHAIRKFVEYSSKDVRQRQCFFLSFWRNCCPKVGRYCDPPSGEQGRKGYGFSKKNKKKILRIC